jgi:cyclophilin family peptidyl-prolyl cis-trans isomerase
MIQPRFVVSLVLAGLIAGTAASGQQAKPAPKAPSKAPAKAAGKTAEPAGPVVVFEFAKGNIEIELSPSEAPKSVEHVMELVRGNFYRGQRIWWSTPALIQFGDPLTKDMTKKDMWGTGGSGHPVGVDETKMSKHKFVRGVVGLGYRQDFSPKTADSYFIIIKGTNSAMDGKYAVIGKVTEGMAVADKLEVPDVIKNAYMKGEKK